MSENSSETLPRINRLSLQLANQIAAGEVVERPASVVKELMENSLDAGSKSISVDIIQGGTCLIRVRDDGRGINPKDMHLAVSRHATSKLHNLEELENILSLGFRGEALASISSVSRLALHSKSNDSDSKAWCIDTGNDSDFANYKADLIPSSLPNGTMLEVRDLFYNTPARRKFLRSEKTEFRYIEDVFKRIALSFYDVSFQLSHNKKLVRKLPAVGEQGKFKRLEKLFGKEFCQAANVVNFKSQNLPDIGTIEITGWVANSQYLRTQANQQYFYVNGRFVRDKLLNHAIRQVFQELIPSEMYAAYVLYLQVAPNQVDVNVHPTKHEVRFRHARMIHDFIVSAINQALSSSLSEPQDYQLEQWNTTENQSGHSFGYQRENLSRAKISENLDGLEKLYHRDTRPQYYTEQNNTNSSHSFGGNLSLSAISRNESSHSQKDYPLVNEQKFNSSDIDDIAEPNENQNALMQGRPLTVISGRFFIAEIKNELWIIDLVQCMPVVNCLSIIEERLQNKKLNVQRLLIPECIQMETKVVERLLSHQNVLSEFGLQFTQAGPSSIMLRQIVKLPFKVHWNQVLEQIGQYLFEHEDKSGETSELGFSELAAIVTAPIDLDDGISQTKQLFILDFILNRDFDSRITVEGSSKEELKQEMVLKLKRSFSQLASNELEKILLTHR